VAAVLLLHAAESLPMWVSGIAAFFVAVALAGVGGIFESAKWAGTLETARQVTIALACVYLLWTGLGLGFLAWAGLGLAVASLAVLLRYRSALTATELAPLM
ncbi:MAG TPA: hypothetical protein PK788_04405, partial [Gemmatimonadaceae bacterium]|nr:hypothetical protein [Gemmatimonadaceae bacterium]